LSIEIRKSIALAAIALILGISLALTPYLLYTHREKTPTQIPTTAVATITKTTVSTITVTSLKTLTPTATETHEYIDSRFTDILGYLLQAKSLYSIAQSTYISTLPLPVLAGVPSTPTLDLIRAETSTSKEPKVSETNVQVVGVDEPDIVKTNGRLIAVASSSSIYVVDALDRKVLSVLNLKGEVIGVFLCGDTLTAIVRYNMVKPIEVGVWRDLRAVVPLGTVNTSIFVIDLTDAVNPRVKLSLEVTGNFLDARRIDKYVYLVLTQDLDLNVISKYTLILPFVNGEPLNPENIHRIDQAPTSYVNIAVVDLENSTYNVESFLISRGSRIYMIPGKLYIVSDEIPYRLVIEKVLEKALTLLPEEIAKKISEYMASKEIDKAYQTLIESISALDESAVRKFVDEVNKELSTIDVELTRVYVFNVRELSIQLSNYFEVPGRLLDQFAIEEVNNITILATTVSNLKPKLYAQYIDIGVRKETVIQVVECSGSICTTRTITRPWIGEEQRKVLYIGLTYEFSSESENNVYIYDANTYKLLGKLEGLAKSERIYSARVVKNILFLVTFRNVDPLFAIDISDPSNPKVLGFLKIPGFSEYLHPLPNDMLLGIGREGSDLKISLFDVSIPADMKEVSRIYISNSYSEALYNHRAVTLDIEFGRIYIPVMLFWQPEGIAVIQVKDSSISLTTILMHQGSRRAIYIGNELYTVALNSIKIYNYQTLEELYEIPLTG